MGSDDELVAAVAKSVQHEGLFEHYHDDLKAYLKNFASYGWDEKADRQAEAYLQKYREEMRLHYAGKDELWQGLALGATEAVRKDRSNDRLESIEGLTWEGKAGHLISPITRRLSIIQRRNCR